MLPGVYMAKKKDKKDYYRASITYRNKHISLGSYPTEVDAHNAYLLAGEVLSDVSIWHIDNYPSPCILSFQKWVVLINFRDHHIYIKNPIYLKQRYFIYYFNKYVNLKFDVDDLFYYSKHKIMKRGGHLFVSDYGMQVNILSRYGIKNHAVPGRDYIFSNGDSFDYRYGNIEIINRFYGVTKTLNKGKYIYNTKIHINGNFLVGRYNSEIEAAIAYNKAVLILRDKGYTRNFPQNYIEEIDEIKYASIYQRIRISKRILSLFTI